MWQPFPAVMNGRNQMTPKFWTAVGMYYCHTVSHKHVNYKGINISLVAGVREYRLQTSITGVWLLAETAEIFLFPTKYGPVLGSTQPPLQENLRDHLSRLAESSRCECSVIQSSGSDGDNGEVREISEILDIGNSSVKRRVGAYLKILSL
jgi:hypothetical protein